MKVIRSCGMIQNKTVFINSETIVVHAIYKDYADYTINVGDIQIQRKFETHQEAVLDHQNLIDYLGVR